MRIRAILIVVLFLAFLGYWFQPPAVHGQEGGENTDNRDGVIEALKEKVQVLENARAENKEEIDRLVRENKRLLDKGPGDMGRAPQDAGGLPKFAYNPAVVAQDAGPGTDYPAEDPAIYKKANEAFIRGKGYYGNGDFESARREFEAALELNPRLMAARAELADCYRDLKDYDNALAQYKVITSKMPYAVDAYKKMADIYLEEKDTDSARKVLKEASALNPAAEGLHEKIGVILYDEGLFEEAKTEFKEELAINRWAKESKKRLGLIDKQEREAKRKAEKK